ncbi:MAG TPA: hypothetical protein VFK43_13250, partial [Acidimicrobiales bacterium]|nr:hypothetical protein [Acidimicrobiales bacterium]
FTFWQLQPRLLLADTTPAGGDMGAHVWGPAYLRDHLLSEGRLSGWAPDWYAGFPAYQFYMVVPALLIVLLDTGVSGWAALVPLAAGLGLLAVALTHAEQRVRRVAAVAGLAVILLGCGLPYGVAFKFVTVSGLLALPVACYLAARLADLPFPGPPIAALGATVFLFNREPVENSTGHIIGGNMASTLAGEFSFSISFAFLVLYLGFLLRGLRRGGYRATCAVLLALCALCHIIPAIYAVVATAAALLTSLPLSKERLKWFLPVGPVAVMIAAFWIGPFYLRSGYLNDMGWEKIPGGILERSTGDLLFRMWLPGSEFASLRTDVLANLFPGKLMAVTALAAVGIVVSVLLRIRLGVLLTICGAVTFVAFLLAPQGRLWNARLLPFWFLCMCLLAAIAVAELGRAVTALVTSKPEWRISPASLATPAAATIFALVYVGLPLGVLPGQTTEADGSRDWLWFEVASTDRNVVPAWAEWNYDGYERKAA